MKKILKLTFIGLFTLRIQDLRADLVKVHVPGAVCSMCLQGFRKQFKKEELAASKRKSVKFRVKSRILTLKLKDKMPEKEIFKRISDAGYPKGLKILSREDL